MRLIPYIFVSYTPIFSLYFVRISLGYMLTLSASSVLPFTPNSHHNSQKTPLSFENMGKIIAGNDLKRKIALSKVVLFS